MGRILNLHLRVVLSCFILVSGVLYLNGQWVINHWSWLYLREKTDSRQGQVDVGEPPDGHLSASIWRARDALEAGEVERALALMTPLVEARGDYALTMLGLILDARGDGRSATAAWLEAENPYSLWDAGSRAAELGDFDSAELYYLAAQDLEPERGILPLANFYSRRAGDLKTARDVLREALLTYPDSRFRLSWMRRQGEILVELEEWGEAQQVYTELAAQFPDDISSLIGLGWLIYERGDGLDAAVTVFERAIEGDPERGEGYFAMGQILAQAGRYAEADSWLRLAIEREPQNLYWWLERANMARDAGNLALALEIYDETLSRFPEHAGTYYHMAWAYRLDEQPEQAILSIERALALKDPPDAKFYARAGEIYEWRGDLEKARVAYERALTLDPGNDTAAAGLRRLEED